MNNLATLMNNFATLFSASPLKQPSKWLIRLRPLLLACLLALAAGEASAQGQPPIVVVQTPTTTTTTPAAAPRTGATGAITGRVTSEDGRPLADAVIFLGKLFARVQGPPITATTDSEGRFRVSGLDSGLFSVSAMLPGYAPPDAGAMSGETSNYYRIGDTVNLTLVKGGVITGTVRDSNNEPVVAAPVRAVRVRDVAGRGAGGGRVMGFSGFLPERMTDDRGVYRIYGLPPGAYVVSVGGGAQRIFGTVSAYEGDTQTFFPSSTRDTAAEVSVRSGEETTGIDIRYRGERGHTISGTVSGMTNTSGMPSGASVTLRHTLSGIFEGASFVMPGAKPVFSFNGVSDGEYELAAQQFGGPDTSAASLPRRITVKGADITGIEVALAPLASIDGHVQLEPPPKEKCTGGGSPATLLETVISARLDEKNKKGEPGPLPFFSNSGTVPSDQGEFTIRNLMPGNYRLTTRLPGDEWYVRTLTLPGGAPSATSPPAQAKSVSAKSETGTTVVALKAGERLMNVTVQIAQDGAVFTGRVTSSTEGAELPSNLKVYLIPSERERAENVLRYAESTVNAAGEFAFKNLAPGRYWVMAQPAPESEPFERPSRPLFWDAETRSKLRREAEAANTVIELGTCQRSIDYALRYGAAK